MDTTTGSSNTSPSGTQHPHQPPPDPGPGETTVETDTDQPDPRDTDLVEADDSGRRPGKVTVLLAAGIIATLGFTAGTLAQKRWGGSTGGAPAGARSAMLSGGGGAPAGGGRPPGQYGQPDQLGQAGQLDRSATGASGTAGTGGRGSAAATPVASGTIVSARKTTLQVKSPSGTLVTVKVPATTPVTVLGIGGSLTTGLPVSVYGTKASDGTVTATSVVTRTR